MKQDVENTFVGVLGGEDLIVSEESICVPVAGLPLIQVDTPKSDGWLARWRVLDPRLRGGDGGYERVNERSEYPPSRYAQRSERAERSKSAPGEAA